MNLSSNYTVAKKHLDIDNHFVAVILVNQVDQLIWVYTSQGGGHSTITMAIQKTMAGLLKVKSFTLQEIGMVTIMFHTGGQKLVYAANHGLGLPMIQLKS